MSGSRPWTPAADRFWQQVDASDKDGCWIWKGSTVKGYGKLRGDGGRKAPHLLAHRFAYELLVGPIPKGLEIDHLCRVPLCCNPAHMEPVTHRVNDLRGFGVGALNAQKTHCIYGHPFDEANTYVTPRGHRVCRVCYRRNNSAYAYRRRRKGG